MNLQGNFKIQGNELWVTYSQMDTTASKEAFFKIVRVFSDVIIINEHYCHLGGRSQGCCTP